MAIFFFKGSALGGVLRTGVFTYLTADLAVRVYTGYRRRRPYWTGDSWRRYLIAVGAYLASIAIAMGIATGVDMRLPIFGAGRTALRFVWVVSLMVFAFTGGIGLLAAIDRLNAGEASAPFTLPRWLQWRRQRA